MTCCCGPTSRGTIGHRRIAGPLTWSGFPVARSAWAPTTIIPRKRRPTRDGGWLLDRPHAGDQPTVHRLVIATGHKTHRRIFRRRPRGAACGGDRYLDKSSRISLREEDCSNGIIVSPHSEEGALHARRHQGPRTTRNLIERNRRPGPQPSQYFARLVGAGGRSGDNLRRAGAGAEGCAGSPGSAAAPTPAAPSGPQAQYPRSSGATMSASPTSVPTRTA